MWRKIAFLVLGIISVTVLVLTNTNTMPDIIKIYKTESVQNIVSIVGIASTFLYFTQFIHGMILGVIKKKINQIFQTMNNRV